MDYYYKSHSILITTWGRVDGFTPELRINKQLAPLVFETLKINQPFPTKAEAARFALEVAKRWIDDGKPIPHSMDRNDSAFPRCRILTEPARA